MQNQEKLFSDKHMPVAAYDNSSMTSRHSSATAEHYSPENVVEAARGVLGGFDLDPASCAKANEFIRAKQIFTAQDNGFSKAWHGSVFLNPPGGFCDGYGNATVRATKSEKACTETGSCGLPPGHKHTGVDSSQKLWWFNFANQWKAGTTHGIFLCFSVELLQSTQVDTPLGLKIPLDFPICYPRNRLAYRTNRLPGPTPSNPDRKPTKKQLADFAATGTCVGDSPPHSSCIIYLPSLSEGPDLGIFKERFQKIGKVTLTNDWRK